MARKCVCIPNVTPRECIVTRFKAHGWASLSVDAECTCTCHDAKPAAAPEST